jgi:hypothetical protein
METYGVVKILRLGTRKVSGQLYLPAFRPLGKEPSEAIGQEAASPQSLSALYRIQDFLSPATNNLGRCYADHTD